MISPRGALSYLQGSGGAKYKQTLSLDSETQRETDRVEPGLNKKAFTYIVMGLYSILCILKQWNTMGGWEGDVKK